MMVEVEGGAWFKFDEVKGFTLRPREEIIDKVRQEGASVNDDAPIAVFISNDNNEICYAVDGNDGIVFLEDVCFTPDNYDETCEAVARALKD